MSDTSEEKRLTEQDLLRMERQSFGHGRSDIQRLISEVRYYHFQNSLNEKAMESIREAAELLRKYQ